VSNQENVMRTQSMTLQSPVFGLPTQPGFWPLASGKALGLRASCASVLRIASGRVWATFDGPHAGAPNDQGDLALGAGEALPVAAGKHLVIEPMDRCAAEPVYFSFDAAPPASAQETRDACAATTRWQVTVLQPARQFGAATAQALLALGGLLWGLASYAEFLAAGRGRVLGPFESNSP
jgi:hypothetical protein